MFGILKQRKIISTITKSTSLTPFRRKIVNKENGQPDLQTCVRPLYKNIYFFYCSSLSLDFYAENVRINK